MDKKGKKQEKERVAPQEGEHLRENRMKLNKELIRRWFKPKTDKKG